MGKQIVILTTALSLTLASCGISPPVRTLGCAKSPPPAVTIAADGTASTTLTVLTYNIEGLGFPARSGRGQQLREIGQRLAAMNQTGTAPDIVMVQEMFSADAKRAIGAAGYPALVAGPSSGTRTTTEKGDKLPGKAKLKRGEVGLRLAGSGLAIASRFPVTYSTVHAFGKRSCAGIDCLSNKGVVMARIHVPGVPTPVDLYATHMNSRGASKAGPKRNTAAHDRQALEVSRFIDDTHDDSFPVILGGDFNMRRSATRWENFRRYQSFDLVHEVCANPASGCEVKISWDGDAPWMDTQDLQFYWGGSDVSVQPIQVEAMFDGRPDSPTLSDHDGFLVTYRLSWPARLPSAICAIR